MSMTVHQRPGVYSSYDASGLVSGGGKGRLVGLVGVSAAAQAGTVQTVTSYDQALTLFGDRGCEGMAELIRLALKNGASGVAAVARSMTGLVSFTFSIIPNWAKVAEPPQETVSPAGIRERTCSTASWPVGQ